MAQMENQMETIIMGYIRVMVLGYILGFLFFFLGGGLGF